MTKKVYTFAKFILGIMAAFVVSMLAGVPGKNKIEKGFRIWVDDSGSTPRDLSVALVPGSLTGGGQTLDTVEMTGVGNAIKQYLAGHGDAPIAARFYVDDTATTGAFTVLNGVVGTGGLVTLQYGSAGVAPDTGDPEWEGNYVTMGNPVSVDSGRLVMDIQFLPESGTAAPAWGTVA